MKENIDVILAKYLLASTVEITKSESEIMKRYLKKRKFQDSKG